MIDASAQAFTAQGIYARGIAVTFVRVSGVAPRTASFSADVIASVEAARPDSEQVARTGGSARQPGAITQTDRMVIVMAQDLQDARFPLPIRKGDKLVVQDTGDRYVVTDVDALKRAMAGAIELTVTGTS